MDWRWTSIPIFAIFLLLVCITSIVESVVPTQHCENYSICLQRLEAKQRECSKFPEVEPIGKENFSSNQTECSRKKRREVNRDMAQLNLRKTEIIRDCVAKNVNRGESIKNADKEKKCLATSEKLSSFAEILKSQVAAKGTRKSKSKSSAVSDSRSKRHSKRKESTKQNSKLCRRAKKALNRKCHQLAKCCTISKECDLLTESIDEQLDGLKNELKSPTCHSK
uniref:Uncharacterized protein n=1 Tax=Ditylenchus dipsaci TaxID=166011 RepID=A0A915DUC0_9BILA